jgi:hypothetical protein
MPAEGPGHGPTNRFSGDGWGRGPIVSHVCFEGDGISDGLKPTRHMEAITDEILDASG